jgi:hypothetical protein
MAALLADITTNLMLNGQAHELMQRSPLAQATSR